LRTRSILENYLFIAPAAAIFAVFYVIPFFWVLQLGMYNWDGISPAREFIGLANFRELAADGGWWRSMGNAGYITLIALTFQNALAFMLALACDRQIRLKRFYTLVFFIPPILSEIVVGLVWRFIINDVEGANLINRSLAALGMSGLAHGWLSDPKYVLTTVAVVHSWRGFGWGFLIFLAGLQTIPREVYEAARVDGANAWRQFKDITLPLMAPVTALVAILTVLGTMQSFALIMGLVGGEFAGHTSVPVLRILHTMLHGTSRFGYACSAGITFGMVLVAVSFMQYRLSLKFKQA
jgi:ABC-type sugar transport system permease subunit